MVSAAIGSAMNATVTGRAGNPASAGHCGAFQQSFSQEKLSIYKVRRSCGIGMRRALNAANTGEVRNQSPVEQTKEQEDVS
jgi:hypothetical protein